MSTQTVPTGGFALKAKKADCLKFSRRGPLRSSVPAHIDGHKQDIVEVSSHQGPRGGLNTDPIIARNGRTTPRRASQSAGAARSGNATPNGAGTPRRASVVVSPTGSPYITGLTTTPGSTPVRAGLYDRSPARYAAPPLTANQQHLLAARSGRSVSPSDPNYNLLHSSTGEPHNHHHSTESIDGGEYQLDAVTVKYDPIALLLHGGIVNTSGSGHNGGGRRNTRNLSLSANASATEVHENIAARHRRTHAISLERAIEADQRQQSNLNTGIIRNTIKEMRRSVSPSTCGLAKSTFGAASVGPASPLKGGYIAGLSTTTNVPAPVGTRDDVITSPSYKLRKEPFSGDLYATSPSSSLSSPQRRYDAANVSTTSGASSPSKRGVSDSTPNGRGGANVSTCSVNASSISQSTTVKGAAHHVNNSTHNNGSRSPSANSRRVVTPRGTVTTSDYGTSVAYEPLSGSAAKKDSPPKDAVLSHHTEAADKTPVKGGEVDGQTTEGTNDAPQTVPLQHPGFFTKEKLHGPEDASPAAAEDTLA